AGMVFSRLPSDGSGTALEAYDDYNYQPFYRSGVCFTPPDDVLEEACLALDAHKTNWLLWGDSFAAHYYYGLHGVTEAAGVHLLQATQPACRPTLNAAAPDKVSCQQLARQMQAFFR